MSDAWLITIIGILTVFGILILLMVFTSLFKFISAGDKNKAKKELNLPKQKPVEVKKNIIQTDDEEEIAAVMAAISCYMGNNSNYVVKKVIKKSKQKSLWGMNNPVKVWRTR